MSNIGKLCYKHGGDALAYKHGGDALIYKAAPVTKPGDIILVYTASQLEVGPIKSCGNIHKVVIHVGTNSGEGSLETVVPNVSATISGHTESSGCAYPEENPQITVTVVAIQPTTGVTKQTTKNLSNVANYESGGTFTVSVTCDATGKLTGLK